MKDKALDTFSVILFGTGGIAILVLAWVQPMPVWERILTSLVGSVGLVGVLVRAPGLRSMQGKMGAEKPQAEVEGQLLLLPQVKPDEVEREPSYTG